MLGHRTCHTSVGLVILKLGLRPSFILNEKSRLSLELNVATSDLSLHHRTCHLETEPSFILNEKVCLFLDLDVGRWDLSLQHWTCHLEAGPSAKLDS